MFIKTNLYKIAMFTSIHIVKVQQAYARVCDEGNLQKNTNFIPFVSRRSGHLFIIIGRFVI